MNKSYKLVFNKKRGEFVVASELAQGAKKENTKKMLPLAGVALLSVLGVAQVPALAFSLETEYTPGLYVDGNGKEYTEAQFQEQNGKEEAPKIVGFKNIHNGNMSTNTGVKFVNGKQTYTFNQDITFNAKSNPDVGLYKIIGLQELIKDGYLELTHNEQSIENYEEVYGWDIDKAQDSSNDLKPLFSAAEIEVLKAAGKWETSFDELNIEIIGDIFDAKDPLKINQEVKDLKKQPHQPFNDFTLVKVAGKNTIFNQNTFVLSPEEDVKWELNYSKNTSLFIAEGRKSIAGHGGKIEVGLGKLKAGETQKEISVDFGSDHAVVLKELHNEKFKVKNKLKENVIVSDVFNQELFNRIPILDEYGAPTGETYGDRYSSGIIAIKNDEGFAEYYEITKAYAKSLVLNGEAINPTDFNKLLKKALENSDEEYELNVLKQFEINEAGYLLTEEMKASGGVRSIVKASGKGSSIVLNEDVRLHATASSGRAYNVYAEDEAEVSHKGKTGVYGTGARNALINNSTYTNEKDGEQYVGYQSEDGGQTSSVGLHSVGVGDTVIGAKGTHINKGAIFVAAKGRNTALFVSDGATAENRADGKYYIGSIDGGGIASGVELQGNGTFINKKAGFISGLWTDDGLMTLGIAKDDSNVVVKSSDNPRGTNDSSKYSTIVSVKDKVTPDSTVTVRNEGTMIIGELVTGAVALDIQGKVHGSARYEGKSEKSKNKLELENSGTITLKGTNNIGIKSTGVVSEYLQSKIVNKGKIEVHGSNSYGIYAADGSIVSNKGEIHVTSAKVGRNYAVVANNATINLEKEGLLINPETSKIVLEGDNVVGLMAVAGGVIYTDAVDKPTFGSGTNQIHYWISGGYQDEADHRSRILFGNKADLSIVNEDSILFRVDKGAELIANNTASPTLDKPSYTFTVKGKDSIGIFVADTGTKVEIDETILNVAADGATGIKVTSGAGLDDKVELSSNTKINVSGDGATVAIVDGAEHDSNGVTSKRIGAKLISRANLASENISIESGAIGYHLLRRGELDHQGSINFTDSDISAPKGKELVGVRVEGGTLTNSGSIKVNGVGVDIYKDDKEQSTVNNSNEIIGTNGIAAIRVNKDANLTVEGTTEGKIIGQNSADAILAKGGSTLTMIDGKVLAEGSGAGIHFQNADDEAGAFSLSGSGEILVTGSWHGIHVEGIDGKTSENGFNSANSKGLEIKVKDGKGNGLLINTSGDIHSGVSVSMDSLTANSALKVTGGSGNITQSGILKSSSHEEGSAVVDLTEQHLVYDATDIANGDKSDFKDYTFTNLGQILAKVSEHEKQIAIHAASGSGTNINIVNGSIKNSIPNDQVIKDEDKVIITGDIKLDGSANYNVQLYGNSMSENTITGSGDDTFMLTNVNGVDDSTTLFKALDGGLGKNILVLKYEEGEKRTARSHYVFSDAKLNNISDLKIENTSIFELAYNDQNNSKLVDAAKTGEDKKHLDITIAKGGELFINQGQGKSNYSFENKLTGDGLVTTDLGSTENKFNFINNKNTGDFKGRFAIGKGTFEIAKENAQALANATLRLDGSGIGLMKKDSRDERIGGLKFNNGQLVVEEKITTGKIDNAIDSMLTVGKLDLGKGGSISLSLGKEVNEVFSASTPDTLYSKDLLLQDEGKTTIKLVHSEGEVENGGAVVVVDIDGNKINLGDKAEKEIGIYQDGIEDSVATGKYGLVTQTNDGTGKNEGLYLSYALKSVTLNGQVDASKGADWYKGALNLQVASDGSDNAQEFKAAISGDGDLVINTDPNKAELKLSGTNDYKGATYVISGGLELLADTALGKTRLLDIASGSSVRLSKDVESKVGQLNTSENSGLHLGAGGQLTITGQKYDESDIASDIGLDSLIAGSLTGGAGAKLVLEKYKLQVVGANTAYKGDVDVHVDTTLELNHTQGVGNEGQIDLAGKLHLNGVGQGAYQKQIIGTDSNEVLVDNNSTVVFVADHTGISNINIGGATGSDVSRVIVQKEQHLAGTDGLAISDVNIRKNSTLELNTNEAHWVVNNKVDGAGNLHKSGAGMIELIKDSAQYTGKTTVESGILIAGNNENALDLQSTEMFIAKAGTFTGLGSINGSVINEGNFFVGQLFDLPEGKSPDEYVKDRPEYVEDKNADITDTLALTKNEAAGNDVDGALKNDATGNDVDDAFKNKANYIVKKDFTNKGNVFLSNSFTDSDLSTGTNLLVRGNYISSGGAIFMNTVLNAGHEEATTDKLIVEGDVKTDGEATKLYISNAQGLGAYTDQQPDAIKVVHVDGQSDHNAFTLGNQVAIGVYEYTLHQGRNPENSQSWFLDSYDKNLNPGIGAFIGNQNAAIGMFSMTLHDRMGNLGYSDPSLITEDDDTLNSAWVRIVAERNKYKAIDQKMSIKSNTYIVHLGTDFYKWTDDLGATRRLGVMAGYGHGDIKSRSNTGFNAQGKIDSAYNVGLYGTYYNPNGFYVDAWAQHSWFKNEISIGGASKNYRSKLLSLSLEVGHTFDISEVSSEGKQWRFQPQGQVTWHKYKLRNNVVSDSGLAVTNLPSHTTVARLGAKFIYANAQDVDSKMQPFVELNWIHSNANKAIEFNDWYTTSNNAPKNRYELKVGIEGKYNNRWSVWGNVATQMGKDSYRNYRGTVGAKYDF